MSNYPAGVSDNHPYFNPPREIASGVECGADEALVVPSYAVKAQLNELLDYVNDFARNPVIGTMQSRTIKIRDKIEALQKRITELEQEREYECPFNDEIDLPESECARWDCPVCGNERETDTMPEDVDPDRAYEEMRDARYDD